MAKTYTIDPKHSSIGFAVKHLQVSTVTGHFNDFSGEINYDKEDLSSFKANTVIEVKSIDTNVEGRDEHLKKSDFFDADNHPVITFMSKRLEKRGEGTVIIGDLTIKGISKTLIIPVAIAGPVKSPHGAEVIGLTGEIQINRQDFGVSWSKTLDNGGLMVDDIVRMSINLELSYKE